MYPRTLPGLAECYVAAIPFFRNSLAGDAIFTTVLFGSFGVAERYLASLREPVCTPKQGSCELACQSVTRGPTCR